MDRPDFDPDDVDSEALTAQVAARAKQWTRTSGRTAGSTSVAPLAIAASRSPAKSESAAVNDKIRVLARVLTDHRSLYRMKSITLVTAQPRVYTTQP